VKRKRYYWKNVQVDRTTYGFRIINAWDKYPCCTAVHRTLAIMLGLGRVSYEVRWCWDCKP
jgi:hypothetical protein